MVGGGAGARAPRRHAVRRPDLRHATPSDVPQRLGEAVGGGGRVGDVIARRRMLLVLDNFEQVLDGAPVVAALLGALSEPPRDRHQPRARCTSSGERVVALAPAGGRVTPRRCSWIAPGPRCNGGPRAGARRGGRDATSTGCRWRSSWRRPDSPALSLQAIRAQIANQLDLLGARASGCRRSGTARIRETIAWSYDLLEPAPQAAFRKLSVLAPGFDLDAALAVGEADLEFAGSARRPQPGSPNRRPLFDAGHDPGVRRRGRATRTATQKLRAPASSGSLRPGRSAARRRDGRDIGRGTGWVDACTRDQRRPPVAFDWAATTGDTESLLQLLPRRGDVLAPRRGRSTRATVGRRRPSRSSMTAPSTSRSRSG